MSSFWNITLDEEMTFDPALPIKNCEEIKKKKEP